MSTFFFRDKIINFIYCILLYIYIYIYLLYIYIYIYLLLYYLPAFTVTRKKEEKTRQEQEIKISRITTGGGEEKIS